MLIRILLMAAALLGAAHANAAPVRTEHVEAELVAERTAWLAGTTNWIAVRLEPDAGWHTYWRNPGDSGLATTVAWTLPPGWEAGAIVWPHPRVHRLGDLVNYGYGEETLLLVPIALPPSLAPDAHTVGAHVKFLVCADICIPGEAHLELTLPTSEIATQDPRWASSFARARAQVPAGPPLSGRFEQVEGELRLEVAAPELAGATGVAFFPLANNLVNHGAVQRVALSDGGVRFAQAVSSFSPGPPLAVEGVLVVHGASGTRAYEVRATEGAVATVAMPAAAATPAPVTPEAPPSLLLVLGFALLGGLILNLMPCVFPVLSIKAVSVLEGRRGDRAGERAHALAYAAGVILSCAAVAALLVLVRGGGELLGWGFQLQSPVFVALLAYFLLALGLSLSGVAAFGTRLMGVGQELAEQGGYAGSFFTGVLAVVVASPCTAPFMGTALGYALVQPAPIAILVFVTLGLGLALPFLLLGFFPALGAWLPRPGRWMETFKQLMAFPLYLTVAWLVWVLGRQAGVDGVGIVLAGLVLVALALWLWGATRNRARAAVALVAGVAALGLLAHPAVRVEVRDPAKTSAPAIPGAEAYSDERLTELRAQNRAVFVNFTADWCISCKVNEKVVLSNAEVLAALAHHRVVWLTADWTTSDPKITTALARFGRSGVPLYVLYPPGREAVVLPQILTPETFVAALAQIETKED